MTQPAPVVTPPVQAWPKVFDGIGALVVNCALDPDLLADKIPGLTWLAVKVGGSDVAGDAETQHCAARWRSRGLEVGVWVYCAGPPAADAQTAAAGQRFGWPAFVVYDVEAAYKADEGGHYEYAAQLVTRHAGWGHMPAAVTSYGAYKDSIDFATFASAGWPILAQVYDSFRDGDETTYYTQGPYPEQTWEHATGVHRLTRRLVLKPGEAVYRPESINA